MTDESLETLRERDLEQRLYIAELRETVRILSEALIKIAEGDLTPAITARIALWNSRPQ